MANPRQTGPLTDREIDVVKRLATGGNHKMIAEELEISVKTVEYHSLNARRKIGHPSLAVLGRYAEAAGLIARLALLTCIILAITGCTGRQNPGHYKPGTGESWTGNPAPPPSPAIQTSVQKSSPATIRTVNLIAPPPTNLPVSASFTWTFPPDSQAKGVKLLWGATSGIYTNTIDAGTNTVATISNLVARTRYHVTAQAYSAIGATSRYAPEISWPVPVTNYVTVAFKKRNSLKSSPLTLWSLTITNPPGDSFFVETSVTQTNDFVSVTRLNTSTLSITNPP